MIEPKPNGIFFKLIVLHKQKIIKVISETIGLSQDLILKDIISSWNRMYPNLSNPFIKKSSLLDCFGRTG